MLFLECLGEDDRRCEMCGIYGADKKCMQTLGWKMLREIALEINIKSVS
jgi:hypothetical protein